jgi:hypothetical protein
MDWAEDHHGVCVTGANGRLNCRVVPRAAAWCRVLPQARRGEFA